MKQHNRERLKLVVGVMAGTIMSVNINAANILKDLCNVINLILEDELLEDGEEEE